MNNNKLGDAPLGHLWAKELAKTSQSDMATIVWLCEKEFIQGVNINGQWAIRVLKTTSAKTGKAIVRDLKAGRDISIGSVIGQYITIDNGQEKQKQKDTQELISQKPIRHQVEVARRLIHITWYIIGGGSLFFLVGLILAIPLATLIATVAIFFSNKATRLAEQHGNFALIGDAKHVRLQSIMLASVLWGILILIIAFFTLLSNA